MNRSSRFEVDTGMKSALIEPIRLIAPLSINPKQKEPITESFTEVEKEVKINSINWSLQ
jgi:hypothetical protein